MGLRLGWRRFESLRGWRLCWDGRWGCLLVLGLCYWLMGMGREAQSPQGWRLSLRELLGRQSVLFQYCCQRDKAMTWRRYFQTSTLPGWRLSLRELLGQQLVQSLFRSQMGMGMAVQCQRSLRLKEREE